MAFSEVLSNDNVLIWLCLFCSFAWRLGLGQVYETSVGRPPHGRRTTDGPGGATTPPGRPPLLPPSAIRTANFLAEFVFGRTLRRRPSTPKSSFLKCCSGGVWEGEAPLRNLRYPCLAPGGVWGGGAPSGISVTRALPPQVEVRTVKNLKMSLKGRRDLKI